MSKLPKNCGGCGYFSRGCTHDCAKDVETTTLYLPELCPLKEDVLEAKRFVVLYRKQNIYLIVCLREGTPWEVFVKYDLETDNKIELQYMLASWVCITRFVTLALKSYPLDKTISQLQKSSRLKDDLPGIIAEKLKEWA